MTDFMVQELVNVRNYANIFKRITRYTIKPIGIVLDRFAAPPPSEPTIDPEGEWMKCDQLNGIINTGGLIEYTPELKELLLDGDAQRAFIRDVTALGYTDFNQVMEILRNNRHQLLDEREFEIWSQGYNEMGNQSPPYLIAKVAAYSFEEACRKHVEDQKASGSHKAQDWTQDPLTGSWRNYCGALKPSEESCK